MMKTITADTKMGENRKRDFTNALSGMADQLRLIDQKITMATDNSIQEEFQRRQQELHHAAYMTNKLHQKQQIKSKKLVHNPFIPNKSQKRLS